MKESYRKGVATILTPSHVRAVVRLHLKRWTGAYAGSVSLKLMSSEMASPKQKLASSSQTPAVFGKFSIELRLVLAETLIAGEFAMPSKTHRPRPLLRTRMPVRLGTS